MEKRKKIQGNPHIREIKTRKSYSSLEAFKTLRYIANEFEQTAMATQGRVR